MMFLNSGLGFSILSASFEGMVAIASNIVIVIAPAVLPPKFFSDASVDCAEWWKHLDVLIADLTEIGLA